MSPSSRPLRPLPWKGRLYNFLGATRAMVRTEPYLDRERLLEFAYVDTGFEDFGRDFDPALVDLLLDSAKGANLTFLGRRGFNGLMSQSLAVRLLFVEARKRHREIFASSIRPPLIVTGPPRSGTTLLQNLLALHPDFDAVPNWELQRPVRPSLVGKKGPDNRLGMSLESDRVASELVRKGDHIHFHRATTPGECIVLMLPTLRSWGFLGFAPLYPFLDELLRSDHRILYAEYRDLLALLQHERPDRRLLLKAPAHAPWIDRIMEVLPDASIVALNRDPATAVTSLLSLHRNGFSRSVRRYDVRAHSRRVLDMFAFGLGRHYESRAEHEASVHDVYYPELVDDPVGVVRRIYQRFEIRWPDGHERRVLEYLKANPKGKHGVHRYRPSDFDLTEAEIRTSLAPWCDRMSRNRREAD